MPGRIGLDVEKTLQQEQEGSRITYIGGGVNIALTGFKFAAGFLGNSQAMLADAAHSLSDLISDGITLLTVKLSSKPVTDCYPYGRGKFDSFGALSVGAILCATGATVGFEAIESFQQMASGVETKQVEMIALVAALTSIASKEWLYRATLKVSQKYNSPVLKSNADHHRSDALSSMVALAGIGGSMMNIPMLDPLAGALVSGMIIKTGAEIMIGAFRDLTDRRADDDVLEAVQRTLDELQLQQISGMHSYHRLRMRRMGNYFVGDVHIWIDGKLSASAAHMISERVRLSILEHHPSISEVGFFGGGPKNCRSHIPSCRCLCTATVSTRCMTNAETIRVYKSCHFAHPQISS